MKNEALKNALEQAVIDSNEVRIKEVMQSVGISHVAANDLAVMCKNIIRNNPEYRLVKFIEPGQNPFQSTLPRGSDKAAEARLRELEISIHAPSRERLTRSLTAAGFQIFQSTLPRGSDLADKLGKNDTAVFQSTLPRGSDQAAQSPLTQAAIFQSTLPRGSDRHT